MKTSMLSEVASRRSFSSLQKDAGFFCQKNLLTRKDSFVVYSTSSQRAGSPPSYGTDDRTSKQRADLLYEKDFGALTEDEKTKVECWGAMFFYECFYGALFATLAVFFWYPISFIPSLIWKKKPIIHGWDLYGRVPFDDQFFRTKDLIKPDLFKKNLVESVQSEKAEILGLLDRHFRITNLLYGTCLFAVLYVAIVGVNIWWYQRVLTFE
jgi:hypothetical protein